MDYKEKYLNALEKAREICDTECFYDKRTIESIFPELENKKEWSDCDTNIVKEIKVLINELASQKDALDVNGDYCEQPFIRIDRWLSTIAERMEG